MIDLYFWPTPNGIKPLIFLEEANLDYNLIPVNIGAGDQFAPDFLAIAPNNRIPAIVDHAPTDGGAAQAVFESGAILLYLAAKTGKFMPAAGRGLVAVHEWLMWQMGGVGPMFGQCHHFRAYAPEEVPYAIERYTKETTRLYNVLNQRLAERDFVCDDYSIADMAIYPWTRSHERQGQDINALPHVLAWQERLAVRAAVAKAVAVGDELHERIMTPAAEAEARKHLYG